MSQHHQVVEVTERIVTQLARTAIERDQLGGTPKQERDLLRESGLLTAMIPNELGGLELGWPDTLDSVRRIARVDASLAHVYGFQHLLLATLQLFAAPEQWRSWLASSSAQRWFWGNALNPLDPRTTLTWS